MPDLKPATPATPATPEQPSPQERQIARAKRFERQLYRWVQRCGFDPHTKSEMLRRLPTLRAAGSTAPMPPPMRDASHLQPGARAEKLGPVPMLLWMLDAAVSYLTHTDARSLTGAEFVLASLESVGDEAIDEGRWDVVPASPEVWKLTRLDGSGVYRHGWTIGETR